MSIPKVPIPGVAYTDDDLARLVTVIAALILLPKFVDGPNYAIEKARSFTRLLIGEGLL